MIANMDENGHAQGELFIDDGKNTNSELTSMTYEYYQFQLSANSIKKWVLNEKNTGPVGTGIDSFVIANAKSLLSTDFACLTSEVDGSTLPMNISVSARTNTLTLSLSGGRIQPYLLKNIFFGNSQTDLNLCGNNGTVNGTAQHYTIAEIPDLKS
jgi:hypothetical protein